MPKVVVRRGPPLRGAVAVEPSKNAILPMLAASLLTDEPLRFTAVPWLDDVDVLVRLLARLGVAWHRDGGALTLSARALRTSEAPAYLVSRMRASFLVAGPLVARTGEARLPLPGGCAIGSRPVDLHLKGLEVLGAKVEMGEEAVRITASQLTGGEVRFEYPSVGATENLMMAAALARGTTRLVNAAREPEVVDLAGLLTRMGAEIEGAGGNVVTIRGVRRLAGAQYQVIPDRIEAGTFLLAAALTGGSVTVQGARPEHLARLLGVLAESGAEVATGEDEVHLVAPRRARAVHVRTEPYPGFPTDLQAPLMVLAAVAEGASTIEETVFESRFRHAVELRRLGAAVEVRGRTAYIEGRSRLQGGVVHATDLRAAAALVLAGLVAEGTTEVLDAFHLDRGYVNLERKLAFLGADVERVGEFAEVV